jgi:hypothetical protein
MIDVGAGAWGESAARSGMRGSVGMADGSVGWVRAGTHETEPHGGGALIGSVGWLDHWV